MDKKYTGTGWMRFYINWRFPLAFVFGGLSILAELINASEGGYIGSSIFVGAVAIDVAIYIFRIVVYKNMTRMTETGYNLNVVLLIVESLYLAFPRALQNTFDNLAVSFAITAAIAFLLWFLPNYIYFKHRKYMFTGMYTAGQLFSGKVSFDGGSAEMSAEQEVPADKKFVCEECGHYSSGWYQECPNCGKKGRMVKVTKFEQPAVSLPVIDEKPAESAEQNSEKYICPSCGTEVLPNTKFCRQCGASLLKPEVQDGLPVVPSVCPVCGNRLHDGMKFCNMCGTRISPVSDVVPVAPTITDMILDEEDDDIEEPKSLDLSKLPAALRRAYIFIEDEEWDRAEKYLEKVLDEEPENAYAYLGKALIDIKVDSPEHVTRREYSQLAENRNFRRALKYAPDELREILERWN